MSRSQARRAWDRGGPRVFYPGKRRNSKFLGPISPLSARSYLASPIYCSHLADAPGYLVHLRHLTRTRPLRHNSLTPLGRRPEVYHVTAPISIGVDARSGALGSELSDKVFWSYLTVFGIKFTQQGLDNSSSSEPRTTKLR